MQTKERKKDGELATQWKLFWCNVIKLGSLFENIVHFLLEERKFTTRKTKQNKIHVTKEQNEFSLLFFYCFSSVFNVKSHHFRAQSTPFNISPSHISLFQSIFWLSAPSYFYLTFSLFLAVGQYFILFRSVFYLIYLTIRHK